MTTHSELVSRAKKWLEQTKKCKFVLTEWSGARRSKAYESPDAIGFTYKKSILIECKVSKADFVADSKKRARKQPGRGMGDERYFLSIPGIISEEELPKNWGLLELVGNRIFVKKKATQFERKISGLANERKMLTHALRCVVCESGHDINWFRLSESKKRNPDESCTDKKNKPGRKSKVQ